MEDLLFEIEKEITTNEADFNLDMKLSSIFLFFQEASSLHSEVLGVGKSETLDKNLHWVISRFDVDIIRLPKYNERVKVKTYPGANNGLFFFRHYLITDMKDNVLVRAVSNWVVIDAFTNQLKRNPFQGYSLPIYHLDNELPNPIKINGEANSFIYKRKIRYSDIDLNGHLNNTRYIELIQDSFDQNFYKSHKLTKFSINYNHELKAGDEVSIYLSDSNPYIVSGKTESKDHFKAELTFTNR